jgi:hypothetical protein
VNSSHLLQLLLGKLGRDRCFLDLRRIKFVDDERQAGQYDSSLTRSAGITAGNDLVPAGRLKARVFQSTSANQGNTCFSKETCAEFRQQIGLGFSKISTVPPGRDLSLSITQALRTWLLSFSPYGTSARRLTRMRKNHAFFSRGFPCH